MSIEGAPAPMPEQVAKVKGTKEVQPADRAKRDKLHESWEAKAGKIARILEQKTALEAELAQMSEALQADGADEAAQARSVEIRAELVTLKEQHADLVDSMGADLAEDSPFLERPEKLGERLGEKTETKEEAEAAIVALKEEDAKLQEEFKARKEKVKAAEAHFEELDNSLGVALDGASEVDFEGDGDSDVDNILGLLGEAKANLENLNGEQSANKSRREQIGIAIEHEAAAAQKVAGSRSFKNLNARDAFWDQTRENYEGSLAQYAGHFEQVWDEPLHPAEEESVADAEDGDEESTEGGAGGGGGGLDTADTGREEDDTGEPEEELGEDAESNESDEADESNESIGNVHEAFDNFAHSIILNLLANPPKPKTNEDGTLKRTGRMMLLSFSMLGADPKRVRDKMNEQQKSDAEKYLGITFEEEENDDGEMVVSLQYVRIDEGAAKARYKEVHKKDPDEVSDEEEEEADVEAAEELYLSVLDDMVQAKPTNLADLIQEHEWTARTKMSEVMSVVAAMDGESPEDIAGAQAALMENADALDLPIGPLLEIAIQSDQESGANLYGDLSTSLGEGWFDMEAAALAEFKEIMSGIEFDERMVTMYLHMIESSEFDEGNLREYIEHGQLSAELLKQGFTTDTEEAEKVENDFLRAFKTAVNFGLEHDAFSQEKFQSLKELADGISVEPYPLDEAKKQTVLETYSKIKPLMTDTTESEIE